MSDAASALATPQTLTYQGKQYTLSPLTLNIIAMFERWLEDRAYDVIEQRKHLVAEDDYERLLRGWVEQCASGVFRWGSKAALKASRSRDGMAYQIFLMLAEKNTGMTQKLAGDILDAQLAELMAKVEVVNAVPFAAAGPEAPPTTPTPTTTAA